MRTFGQWTEVGPLGRGGNGEVIKVINSAGDERALKLLSRSRDKSRRQRFRDEVSFLLRQEGRQNGVLPLVDHCLPEDEREDSWLVMPLAIPLRLALGSDPDPVNVVSACLTFAETLADLASRGIGHRDIKPDNLFLLGDEYVIGDFGLVTYPDKDPVTRHGRRSGDPLPRYSLHSAIPACNK